MIFFSSLIIFLFFLLPIHLFSFSIFHLCLLCSISIFITYINSFYLNFYHLELFPSSMYSYLYSSSLHLPPLSILFYLNFTTFSSSSHLRLSVFTIYSSLPIFLLCLLCSILINITFNSSHLLLSLLIIRSSLSSSFAYPSISGSITP